MLDLFREGDAGAVREAYEQLAKDFPGKEVADEAAYWYANFHFGQGRLDKAQDLLLSLKRSGRQNRWVSRAVLGLSEVASKRGDERAMLGYLEEALTVKAAPTGRNLMDTLDTRQEALIRLGRHYRDKGDFNKALDYFIRWEPRSGCGNCWLEMRMEREREITVCRLHLGDHAGVVRASLLGLRQDGGVSRFDAGILCRLYGDAGQLDDLRRLLEDYDATRKRDPRDGREPSRDLRELVRIESLARKKDVAALVALCQDESKGSGTSASRHALADPVHSAGAEALGALDGVDAVRSALAKKPNLTTWLVYALGRSNSPAALQALAELAEQERDFSDGSMTDDIAYALALKGEPGRKVLKRLAEQQRSDMGQRAREWLARGVEPDRPEATWPYCPGATWPPPKAGSLPKTLPDPR
jgi:tetratricopeptide (TPR) repeat protein